MVAGRDPMLAAATVQDGDELCLRRRMRKTGTDLSWALPPVRIRISDRIELWMEYQISNEMGFSPEGEQRAFGKSNEFFSFHKKKFLEILKQIY